LLSATAADAHPSFEITAPSARAGDLVNFSISGVEGRVTYALQVGDKHILDGTGGGDAAGDVISGTFTFPDLGAAVRSITVEAEIQGADKRKKGKRKLEYLGPAPRPTGPPAPAPPPPLPAVAPQPTQSQQPIHSPNRTDQASPPPAVTPPSSRGPRQSGERRAIESPRHAARSGERRGRAHRGRVHADRDVRTGNTRSKRPPPRTAPLFDGVPEPGAGAYADDGDGISGPNGTARRAAVVAPTGARLGDGGVNAAVVVPALLGLAALALAGTAVFRRRVLRRGAAVDPGADQRLDL
jgi:hypothetical protein